MYLGIRLAQANAGFGFRVYASRYLRVGVGERGLVFWYMIVLGEGMLVFRDTLGSSERRLRI